MRPKQANDLRGGLASRYKEEGGREAEREREMECVPYWRIAYFRLGKAADLSNLNLKESELQQQQHQERERERGGDERTVWMLSKRNLEHGNQRQTETESDERTRQTCDK